MKEISKKADIRHAHLEKRTRELNELFTGPWGKLIESLVKGDLVRLLNERNIQVMGLAQENFRRRNGEEYEVDIIGSQWAGGCCCGSKNHFKKSAP